MKKTLIALLFIIGCGGPNHGQDIKDVCEHIEGVAYNDCNAGDDFSPLTCETALSQFEGWWRTDAQASVNHCLSSSACYASGDGVPGPSIQVPLQLCMSTELVSSLQPTDAQTQAVSRFCIKAGQCGELQSYSILDCEGILLNPYDDGPIFLMMNDQVAASVGNCDKAICDDFDSCVNGQLQSAGALSTMNGVGVKMPALMRTK